MTKSRPFPIRLLATLAVIIVLALLFIVFAQRNGTDPDTAITDTPLPVSVMRVKMHDHYVIAREFTGRAVSRRSSDLGFETAGRIEEVRVDNGDHVNAGDMLAKLDTDRLNAQRKELVARLAETEANLIVAKKTAERTKALFAQGHVTEQRLDEALAAADSAAAIKASAAAALASVTITIEKATLTAPYKGVITRRLLDEGTTVTAGVPVLSLIEDGPLEAEVGMPLDFAARLAPGDHVPLKTQSGDLVFSKVRAIVPVIRGETRTALVTLNIVGEAALPIADGSLVTAEINENVPASGFWLPLRALTADVRGLWRVYKVVENGNGTRHVVFENVQIIHSEGDRAYVSGTVGDGDLIIDGGVARVGPGKRVDVVRIDGAATASGGA